jgi:hypothetical protein
MATTRRWGTRRSSVARAVVVLLVVAALAIAFSATAHRATSADGAPSWAAAHHAGPKHVGAVRTTAQHVLADARTQARKPAPGSMLPWISAAIGLALWSLFRVRVRSRGQLRRHVTFPNRAPPVFRLP